MNQFGGAKVDTARLQIADFGAGLDLFFLDVGRYPSSSEGLSALISAPASAPAWDGPYLKKPSIPDDPWGTPYQYRSPGDNGAYDLLSLGADAQIGGEDDNADIVSWE